MHTVVFANGVFEPPGDLPALLASAELLIAADGGAAHCAALGIVPQVVIGDLDSLQASVREELEAHGAQVFTHPAQKDETDLELALLHAKQAGATRVTVLGGLGGRLDHSLANLLLAASTTFAELQILFVHGQERLFLIRDTSVLDAQPGERVSLLPLKGDAKSVFTVGLVYPLNHETLLFGSSRGVSNIVSHAGARVSLEQGLLLCVVSPADLEREV